MSRLLKLFPLWLLVTGCPKDKGGGDDSGDDPTLDVLQLSFEAIPGNGFDVGGDVYDTSAASYDVKETFTEEILADVVPGAMEAVSVDGDALDQRLTPGGFLLATSPSLQIRGALEPDVADVLASALGWTTWQWSVLVTDFGETEGGTGYGTVSFPAGALTPELAQSFFEAAGAVDPGLGGGYTSFGDDLIFLNLRGTDGAPYSGLEDDVFVAGLESAAASFTDADATLSASGEVEAWLVENDWTGAAPDGEDYAAALSADQVGALAPLRETYLEALKATGEAEGWIVTE